ncbi:MAG: hypothetical protein WC965_01395 [Thiohalomonadaceae bacterium]
MEALNKLTDSIPDRVYTDVVLILSMTSFGMSVVGGAGWYSLVPLFAGLVTAYMTIFMLPHKRDVTQDLTLLLLSVLFGTALVSGATILSGGVAAAIAVTFIIGAAVKQA